jgi:Undecaprenyl-phosphate glucose phosphotransferase
MKAEREAQAASVQVASGAAMPANARSATPIAENIARKPLQAPYSIAVLAGTVRACEFGLLTVSGFVIYLLYVQPLTGIDPPYLASVPFMAALAVILLQVLQTYRLGALRSLPESILRVWAAWALTFFAALAAFFFLKRGSDYSRAWLAIWFFAGAIALFVVRAATAMIVHSMARAGRLDRRTVLVGGGEPAESLIRALEAQPYSDIKIHGVFDDRDDQRSPEVIASYPKLGNVDDLVEFARHTRVDLVIFTLPISAEQRILQMLRKLWVLPIDIRLSAHRARLRLRPRAYSYIGSVPVLDVFDKPIADWDIVLKWLFDKIVGSLILLAASPVMLLTALAVRLDSRGPVFFKQRRYGFNNELIEVYKFRSMYADQSDATASRLVTKGDPRVTRVGRFIRKTSLDELPQLINVVFKGNLSLVGPRPHAVHAKAADRLYDEVVDGYFARHKVKPGITGWAQINGWRGETDTPEKIQRRVEHDLYYIENWSILLDLTIIAKTPFALLKTENAY